MDTTRLVLTAKAFIQDMIPPPLAPLIYRVAQDSVKRIDLSKVQAIRSEDLTRLRDAHFLESVLLPQLGFNDEDLREFPDHLHHYCGRGLRHWQYPTQFSKYLSELSKLRVTSYLEIGVRHGGTFVITVEYLSRFNNLERAVAVDLVDCPSLTEYASTSAGVSFVRMDSRSKKFRRSLAANGPFDLVFLDGQHTRSACLSDYNLVADSARIIVFHDIVNDSCPGVQHAWKYVMETEPHRYNFHEFVDQYGIVQRNTGQNFLGIGMAITKELVTSTE
jgi:cephalosporin hydroxylase